MYIYMMGILRPDISNDSMDFDDSGYSIARCCASSVGVFVFLM